LQSREFRLTFISLFHRSALPAGSKISTVSIGGYSWSLYQGTVGTWTVYSFVTNSGEITNFKNDLKLFITYLTTNKGVSTSLLLTAVQAGTEVSSLFSCDARKSILRVFFSTSPALLRFRDPHHHVVRVYLLSSPSKLVLTSNSVPH
jgi:hypothetical protein